MNDLKRNTGKVISSNRLESFRKSRAQKLGNKFGENPFGEVL